LDLKRPVIEQGVLDIIWGLERFAVMDIPQFIEKAKHITYHSCSVFGKVYDMVKKEL
jgi:hypothetical protein